MNNNEQSTKYLEEGFALHQAGKFDQAQECYLKSLELDANNPDANHLLGLIYKNRGEIDNCINYIKKAIKIDANNFTFYFNLGRAYHQKRDLKKSVEAFKKAISIKSDYHEAYFNMGIAYEDFNHFKNAISSYAKALEINPNHIDAKFNMSLAKLANGQFKDGWLDYKVRHDISSRNGNPTIISSKKSLYNDKRVPLAGKSMYVYSEQGYGDTIQFMRLVVTLKEKFWIKNLFFKPQKALVSLLKAQSIFDDINIIDAEPDESLYDYHMPLLDIAWLLDIDYSNAPFTQRYLQPPKETKKELSEILNKHIGLCRVGLVWQGSKTQNNDAIRSCDFSLFLPLLGIDKCHFFCLQKENFQEAQDALPLNLRGKVDFLGDKFADFADTASAAASLDLIISVDTSVAHLCAAMGKETWVILPFAHVWRYSAKDEASSPKEIFPYASRSYWYNCMRLYRQNSSRNYKQLMEQIFTDLKDKVMSNSKVKYNEALSLKLISKEQIAKATELTTLAFNEHTLGNFDKAKELYNNAIAINENQPDANHLLGLILKNEGKIDEAEEHIKRAINISPSNATYHKNLGNLYSQKGEFLKSFRSYQNAVLNDPHNSEIEFLCAKSAQQAGLNDDAKEIYLNILQKESSNIFSLINLAIIENHQKNHQEALKLYKRALDIKPDLSEAYANMAIVYIETNEAEKELECYQKIISLDEQNPSVHFNLGVYYDRQKDLVKALELVQKAHELDPENGFYAAYLLRLKLKLCNWDGLDTIQKQVAEAACKPELDIGVSPQYSVMFLGSLDEPTLAKIAENYSNNRLNEILKAGALPDFKFNNRPKKPKIRIGYVSADYYDHATMHLIIGVLENHNRDDFEIYAYSLKHKNDNRYFDRLMPCLDRFIDLQEMSLNDMAQKIYEDQIDILVDLKGFTQDAIPGIFFLKPAPIQVSWLGMPAGFGSDVMDYIIADEVVIPAQNAPFYKEKMIYMPHCYQPNDIIQEINSSDSKKADHNLPEDAFVFCDFNNPYKIDPDVFGLWMDILKAAPNSVLWQSSSEEAIEDRLKSEAAKRGVDPDRLVFAPHINKRLHLSRMRFADLFLDTLVYNAHTTASDALSAGIPIITLKGNSFAKRVAASLITCIGMEDELVVETFDDYRKKALYYYNNRKKLTALKKKVAQKVRSSALFRPDIFAVDLENQYRIINAKHNI